MKPPWEVTFTKLIPTVRHRLRPRISPPCLTLFSCPDPCICLSCKDAIKNLPSPIPLGRPVTQASDKQQICGNLHLAWLPWNRQAKSEILYCRREVQNGEPFHKFRDEQIAKLLPRNIAKTARSDTTRRMRFAMCRKLLGYNTSLSIVNLPRNKQMKTENLKSIGVNTACFSLFLNQELLWMNYRSIIGFGSRMIRRIMVIF